LLNKLKKKEMVDNGSDKQKSAIYQKRSLSSKRCYLTFAEKNDKNISIVKKGYTKNERK
jgi:hypothetical protein